MFTINLYQNSAEANRVDKTNYLTLTNEVNGTLRESSSILTLVVAIELDTVPNFNYAYVPSFNRYYYVTDIVSLNDGLWEINMYVDVLMTYKDGIKSSKAFVDRNENSYKPVMIDDQLPLLPGELISYNFIQNELFDVTQGEYILQGLLVSQGEGV